MASSLRHTYHKNSSEREGKMHLRRVEVYTARKFDNISAERESCAKQGNYEREGPEVYVTRAVKTAVISATL